MTLSNFGLQTSWSVSPQTEILNLNFAEQYSHPMSVLWLYLHRIGSMDRIRNVIIKNKEIVVIDYSGLKEPGMINLATEVKEFITKTSDPKLIINNFKNTYITSGYVRHMERDAASVKPVIARNALIGLNAPKMMILKGFNLFFGTDFRPFSTEREAIEYLIGEPVDEELQALFTSE